MYYQGDEREDWDRLGQRKRKKGRRKNKSRRWRLIAQFSCLRGLPDPLTCSVECHCDLELMCLDEADSFESDRTFCKELILLSSMLQFIGLLSKRRTHKES